MNTETVKEAVDQVRLYLETVPFASRYTSVRYTKRHQQAFYDFQVWNFGLVYGLGLVVDGSTLEVERDHMVAFYRACKGYDGLIVFCKEGDSFPECRYITLQDAAKHSNTEGNKVVFPESMLRQF